MPAPIKNTPVIAIVGRTNVGKSTLFNRLLGKRKAIVSDIPGTTQDINFGHCTWRDRLFTVIDTAGLDLTAKKKEEDRIRHQAELAMHKADIVWLLVDGQDGPLIEDKAFARHLLKSKKQVWLVVNKLDNPGRRREAMNQEWEKLGLGTPKLLSAANGTGVGDILDEACDLMQELGRFAEIPTPDVRVAIIGRPNVGKSALLNALAGEERVIVSEVAHTTKEPQDTLLTFDDQDGTTRRLLVVDTVGMRKRGNVAPGIEKLGVKLSLDELKNSDVCLLVIDAVAGISLQEKKLGGLIDESRKALIVVVNKWDLAEADDAKAKAFLAYVRKELPFCPWAPIVVISAKSGRSVGKIPQLILNVAGDYRKEIPQEDLDRFAEQIKKQHHAMAAPGYWKRRPKLYGLAQDKIAPPHFTVVIDDKNKLSSGYLGFIENRLRERFGFEGTAINVAGRELKKR